MPVKQAAAGRLIEVFDYPNRQKIPTALHANQVRGSGHNLQDKAWARSGGSRLPIRDWSPYWRLGEADCAGQIEPADGGCVVQPERYAAMHGSGHVLQCLQCLPRFKTRRG